MMPRVSESQAWASFSEWAGTLADLESAASLSGWDRETHMPPGGAESRARSLGTLAALSHRELTRADMGDVIDELADAALEPARAAAVRLVQKSRRRALALPERLVRESSEASSRCVSAWVDAKPAGEFDRVAPELERVVALKREEAGALREPGMDEDYDALLEGFEPGARTAWLEPLLDRVKAGVEPLVAPARDSSAPATTAKVEWPRDAQMELTAVLARAVGFDDARGVIAESAHPFTASPGVGDVRFTTRLDPTNPLPGALASMHELGHALYEQGLPDEPVGTPAREAPSLGAHESQSRLWENYVGRTDEFWSTLAPTLHDLFPDAMRRVEPADLARQARRSQPSLVRVEADEVTYDLHIILRFELEVALIRGDLTVTDLPAAWDERIESLLGVRPTDPSDGAMQDIHWHAGMIGYFPTYTLGNLYAAQLAETITSELAPIPRLTEENRLGELLAFLRQRVHEHGSVHETAQLMRRATGQELSEEPLIRHLRETYVEV
jgi:carboxypeptidase Taq